MRYADNSNGTFTNPLIFADYPDPDIIRVGDDFYMVSSSFTTVPGIPVCHSRDLVNWTIIGHAYDRLPASNPAYSMVAGQVAYRGGSWAPFIRHRDGKFFIGFCTPAEGFFMCIADRPEGPYEILPFGVELYDPGLLFASDGRVFIAHGSNGIFISELTGDARALKSEPVFVFQSPAGTPLEGAHLYERGGWFYLCLTGRGYNGIQTVLRSKNIHGPYEWRIISADDMNYAGAGLHQGGFVELAGGETWFFLFQDRDWVGRVPVLQPVEWVDGWPVIGDPANFGKAVVTARKPALPATALSVPERPDDFNKPGLGLQWQWNHNPDNSRWSLAERPGWLRLRPSHAPDLLRARNTLTQKIPGPACTATTALDLSAIAEHDFAGLSILNIPYGLIGASVRGDELTVLMQDDGEVVESRTLPRVPLIHFRADAGADGFARFSFSVDGVNFSALGRPFLMQFTVKTFLGNRFGLFCYRSVADGLCGHADFDGIELACLRKDNRLSACGPIPFCNYDAEFGTDTQRIEEKRPSQFLVDINHGDWVRFDQMDFGDGAARIHVRAASIAQGGTIEVRLGDPGGELLAECRIPASGHLQPWMAPFADYDFPIRPLSGLQPLCFRFAGPGRYLFRLDHFHFSKS